MFKKIKIEKYSKKKYWVFGLTIEPMFGFGFNICTMGWYQDWCLNIVLPFIGFRLQYSGPEEGEDG